MFTLSVEGNPVCKQAMAEGTGTSALSVELNDILLHESHSELTKGS